MTEEDLKPAYRKADICRQVVDLSNQLAHLLNVPILDEAQLTIQSLYNMKNVEVKTLRDILHAVMIERSSR